MKKPCIATIIEMHNEILSEKAIEIAKKHRLLLDDTPTTHEIDTIVPVAYMVTKDGRVLKQRNMRIAVDGDRNSSHPLATASDIMKMSALMDGMPIGLAANIAAKVYNCRHPLATASIMREIPDYAILRADADFDPIEDGMPFMTADKINMRHPLTALSALMRDDDDFDTLAETM